MQLANASPEKGLYVGLRLDGRVRASGVGSPPYQRFVKELAPVSGTPSSSSSVRLQCITRHGPYAPSMASYSFFGDLMFQSVR